MNNNNRATVDWQQSLLFGPFDFYVFNTPLNIFNRFSLFWKCAAWNLSGGAFDYNREFLFNNKHSSAQ